MQPYFLNVCPLNQRHLRQAAYRRRTPGAWALMIFGLAYFVGFAVFALRYGGIGVYLGILLLAASGCYLLFVLCAPRWEAARRVKHDIAAYHALLRYHYAFCGDGFRVECPAAEKSTDVPYEKIVRVERTKDLYLIRTEKGMYPVSRTGFRVGDPDRFLPFLREKAQGARFPRART